MCAFGSLECSSPALVSTNSVSSFCFKRRRNFCSIQPATPPVCTYLFIYPVFFRVSIHPLQGNSIAIIIRNETILSVLLMEIAFPFLVFEVRSKSQVSVKVKARRNRFKPSPPSPHLCLLSSILVSDCSLKDNRSDRQLFPFEEFCRVKAVA